jgi:tripartite-type tricarboxylate transporter receptor subunit TctC
LHTRLVAALLLGATFVGYAFAQYPTRPIKLVIMTQAGGAPDIIGRMLATRMTEDLGQPVVVENRAGSNGNLAGDYVAKSPADGHTLLVSTDAMFSISPHIYSNMPFDPNKDLAPVATIASQDFVLAVQPSIPAKTLAEFLDYARKANPPLAYASTGSGTQQHLGMELLKARSGINMVHVPYKGGAGATTALLSGEVSVTIGGSTVDPQIKAGKLRALATTGARRHVLYPDVPRIAETYPGYAVNVWVGVFAPAAIPASIVTRLRGELDKFLASPESKEKLGAIGMQVYNARPEEIAATLRRDFDMYGKLVKDIGLRVD